MSTARVQFAPGSTDLKAVACPTVTTCIAVGDIFSGTTSQGVALTLTNGIPGAVRVVPGTFDLTGVACPTTSTCIAVGSLNGPAVVSITDGIPGAVHGVPGNVSELYGVSCPSVTTCVAVGGGYSGGYVVPITNGTPGTPLLLSGAFVLTAVACPTATSCDAVGYSYSPPAYEGIAVAITAAGAGAVQPIVGTGMLHGVACPTATTCEAVGETTNTTSSPPPQGALVTITSGMAGPAQIVPGSGLRLLGVACPRADTCEASGGGGSITPITNGSPQAVQPISGTAALAGMACPIATRCEAVGTGSINVANPLPVGAAVSVDDPPAATFTYPVDGELNADPTEPFTWSTVPGAQGYILVVGTTIFGTDLVNSGVLPPTASTFPVPAFPTGRVLHATLLTERDGGWTEFSEVAFTATPGLAIFTNPVNGQLNVDTTNPFTWSTIPASGGTILAVGTKPFGTDLVNSGILPGGQASFSVPPLPGGVLYATLLTKVAGAFTRYQEVAFTAAGGGARFTAPVDGQTGVNTPAVFTWSPVPGAQAYIVVVGRTLYGTDLVNSGVLPPGQSSFGVPALPAGVALHATILTKVNGAWINFEAVTFTAR